jgi:hypothetical protein
VLTNGCVQLVCEIRSKGGKPLAHPVTGEDVTPSGLKQPKYGRGPQDSLESLERNEYFSIFKALFPHEQKNGSLGCIYNDVLFRPQK